MLGRASELGVLVVENVVSEKRPQLVTLLAPGLGKLASGRRVRRSDRRSRGCRPVAPYGEVTPYGAFAAQVKQVAAMFDTDTDDTASEKLNAAMAALVDEDAAEPPPTSRC